MTVAELQDANDRPNLVRKIQRAVAFLAPKSATLPDTLFGTNGDLTELPADYKPVGIVTADGYVFGHEPDKEDIDALGYASPVRSDITTVARSIKFTPLEYGRRHMLELSYGVDLSTTTQDATTGEVTFDEVDLPVNAEYRLLVIGDDGPADANWILGRGYPRVKLASLAETAWAKEGAMSTEITLDVFTDTDLGTPVRHYFGGTGALAAAEDLGFEATTP